jgi:hypothetical protein
MAEANLKVMEMIEAELKKTPDIPNQELFAKAKGIDKNIGKLSPRQFNARYPLQVKRAMAPKKAKRARPTAGKRGRSPAGTAGKASANDKSRDKVRAVLADLARDVANAQGKGELVDVVMGLDRYVDRVVKAAG